MSYGPHILFGLVILVIAWVMIGSTRIQPKPVSHFYKISLLYPTLFIINPALTQIKAELFMLNSWRDFPRETTFPNGSWKMVPIYGFGKWSEPYSSQLPTVTNLLKQTKPLEMAYFLRLPRQTVSKTRSGYANLANTTLRCHLGIEINASHSSYIAVGKERQYHEKGKWFCYDNSQLNYLANMSASWSNIILVVDLKRPNSVNNGVSKTIELKGDDDMVLFKKFT